MRVSTLCAGSLDRIFVFASIAVDRWRNAPHSEERRRKAVAAAQALDLTVRAEYGHENCHDTLLAVGALRARCILSTARRHTRHVSALNRALRAVGRN